MKADVQKNKYVDVKLRFVAASQKQTEFDDVVWDYGSYCLYSQNTVAKNYLT